MILSTWSGRSRIACQIRLDSSKLKEHCCLACRSMPPPHDCTWTRLKKICNIYKHSVAAQIKKSASKYILLFRLSLTKSSNFFENLLFVRNAFPWHFFSLKNLLCTMIKVLLLGVCLNILGFLSMASAVDEDMNVAASSSSSCSYWSCDEGVDSSAESLEDSTSLSAKRRPCRDDICADCYCNGPEGPRGFCGDTGARGPKGFRGFEGVQGPAGAVGQIYTGIGFYANYSGELTFPDSNTQTVPIPLMENDFWATADFVSLNTTTLEVQQAGIYQFFFHANPTYVNNVYLKIDGEVVDNTVFGIPFTQYVNKVNGMLIFGQAILTVLAESIIELWVDWDGNFGNSGTGANQNFASLLIIKLDNVPQTP